jgi:hypothetical protein
MLYRAVVLYLLLSVSIVGGLRRALLDSIEQDALMDLYNSTNGENWKNNYNWGNGDACLNSWYGVHCVSDQVAFM